MSDGDLFGCLVIPALPIMYGLEHNPKTTVASGVLGLGAGVVASVYAYEPMWHAFLKGKAFEGLNPDAAGPILDSKFGSGVICLIMTLCAIAAAVALANLAVEGISQLVQTHQRITLLHNP
jgi:hypothetical protein